MKLTRKEKGAMSVTEHLTVTAQNAALLQQLSPQNQAYWDALVVALRQQPKFKDEATLQQHLRELLPSLIVAQSAQQTAAQFYGGDPETVAAKMGQPARTKPQWLTWDLLVPVLIFISSGILPAIILPAIPLQGLLVAVQFGLFVIAMVVGLGVTRQATLRRRVLSWLAIVVVLLVAMGIAAKTVPARGLVYFPRGGGSLVLVGFALVVTGFTWWHHRRHVTSWFPAVLGSLWITTLLALLARFTGTAGLMVTTTGNLLIGVGTILGDVSILIIGWHIWQLRQTLAQKATDEH
ncbi:hypothetical protein [Levilactobacillus brevis]|nr:hypothetical protein [Levilactobacillus brevis]